MNIESVVKSDHAKLIDVWEASVRATHYFLSEVYLQELKPLILEQYFNVVDLTCVKASSGEVLGFCGVSAGNIEMLFIAPEMRGKGIGARLVAHAINVQGVTKVDVNEQNEQAVEFYRHIGFSVTGRSPIDGQGKPYPLLHMSL
ncbi:MAG: acetyltransferase [Cellvibrio sp.]